MARGNRFSSEDRDSQMKTILTLMLCSAIWIDPALAQTISNDDQNLENDTLGLLYSSQVQFNAQSIPMVTIGLMEERPWVEISSDHGLVIAGKQVIGGQLVTKKIRTRPGKKWKFRLDEFIPGKVSYWCAVKSVGFSEKKKLNQAIELWKSRVPQVQVFEVGSVFGIQGHVIDNRTYILGIKSFKDEKKANAFAQEIFTKYGSKTFVHAHLDARPSGSIDVMDPSGSVVATLLELVSISSVGNTIKVHDVEFAKAYRWHGFEDRLYAGQILLTMHRRSGLVVINRVPVHQLLQGLVPAEIFPEAPMDALKAQSVVARGEVFAKIGTRHFLDPYLLCAATHCQVYSGVKAENPRTSRAVRSCTGELLFLGSNLVDSVYSACCGGHTEDNDTVWSHPPSMALRGRPDLPDDQSEQWQDVSGRMDQWLDSKPDAFCRISSFSRPELFRWEKDIPSKKMDKLVAEVKPIGHIVSIQVLGRGVSGRVKVVRIVGTQGDLVVQREWPIRQLFGLIKSGMFVVAPIMDKQQLVVGFHFKGGGWGHGVGLCQIGATGMAEQGYDYRQILSHYYGGAKVFSLYGQTKASSEP